MSIYIKRSIEKKLKKLSESFPVIMITGSRQVGKTTLLNNMREQNKINYIYEKFILERYLNNYCFKKTKLIGNNNSFYKNKTHIIKENHKYYLEKEYLEKKYKKNQKKR